MATKSDKENKEVVVTFRLSESEFAPFKKQIEESGLSKSRVMREVVIAKADKVVMPKTQSEDSKRLVFLANKASNNINQLAKKLHLDSQKGVVNSATYSTLLNNLINLERLFFASVKKC